MKQAILVVREFDGFSELFTRSGFKTINFQAIAAVPVEDFGAFDRKLANLAAYDALFVTSPKAAEIFLKRFRKTGADFAGKVYVLGKRAKKILEKAHLPVVFREEANTAQDLLDALGPAEFTGKRFLFVRGDRAARTIPEQLGKIAAIDEAIVYRTVENPPDKKSFAEIRDELLQKRISWVCFFSPSGIESFLNAFGARALDAVKIAAIGATTARRAADKNLSVDYVSPRANAESFARGLIDYIKNIE